MNADSRKEKLFGTIEAFIKTEVLDAYNSGFKDGERAGMIAGNEKGIEIGKASAAGLIAGLRQLLGGLGFEVPAGLPPMVTSGQVLNPITAGRIAEAGRTVVGATVVADLPGRDAYLAKRSAPRELVDLATGEIIEGLDPAEAKQLAADLVDEVLLEKNPGVNFPGYFPLDVPVGDCSICDGFGVIEGELYGSPCMIPCTCTAGEQVKAKGEELAGEKPFGSVCLNQSCVNYSQEKANCDNPATPRLCTEALTFAKPAAAAEPVIECFNEKCEFFDDSFVGGCSVPLEKRYDQPLTACPEFLATAPEAEVATAAVDYECCRLCSLADPDCSACSLVDKEIELRVQARAISEGKPAELPRCANGSCTGNDPKAAKPAVCLRLEKEGRPAIVCSAFVPVENCSHNPARRYNDESGSLVCGVCEKVLQPSRRATPGAASPAPERDSQAAPVSSPADEKRLKLQARCPHDPAFMQVIAGRGEVCTICDLTLTPETLPLFKDDAPEAGKVVEIYQGADQGEGSPQDEEPIELAPECDHPADLRLPSPEIKNGEKIGSIVTCGGCKRVVARFDLDRKPVPPELWPENGAAIGAADIRRHGYKPSELKMIKAGFSLIRYDREDKNLYKTCNDPALGRFLVLHGKTYADCERKLAEELKDPKLVQVTSSGQAADRHAEAKLRAVGFEFYRYEKAATGVSPKIKVGSKNWGMLAKYKDDVELGNAWKKLMSEDPLALEG